VTPVEIKRGLGPILLGMPHTGTWLPEEIRARLNQTGRALTDTDWHIDRLYDGLQDEVTIVRAKFHRYVIDANRDPSGRSLYPGQTTTGLVPLTDFDGNPIWADPPVEDEVRGRLSAYHVPYHGALESELARIRERHGIAVLYDCHSIRSRIPFLFDGKLPDLNIGTNDGKSCSQAVESSVRDICSNASGFSSILNGRFKGGWTTRQYGRPNDNIHAIQMEIAQSAYLAEESAPFAYDRRKADRLRVHLREVLHSLRSVANLTRDAR
jgi:N-formylglutamate deformylase